MAKVFQIKESKYQTGNLGLNQVLDEAEILELNKILPDIDRHGIVGKQEETKSP